MALLSEEGYSLSWAVWYCLVSVEMPMVKVPLTVGLWQVECRLYRFRVTMSWLILEIRNVVGFLVICPCMDWLNV